MVKYFYTEYSVYVKGERCLVCGCKGTGELDLCRGLSESADMVTPIAEERRGLCGS